MPRLTTFLLLSATLAGVACRSQTLAVPPRQLDGAIEFSTYLGRSGEDSIRGVAMDAEGNVYVTGGTESANFPRTTGSPYQGVHDVVVAKFDPRGGLAWSTLIGGPAYDRAYAVEVDSRGYVYVAGRAGADFPTTPGVLQPAFGGDVNQNRAYGAQDGFICKLAPGGAIVWSTYFGSDDQEVIRDIDIDGGGNVYLVTTSVSRLHPHVTAGAFQTARRGPTDAVFAKISSDGSRVVYASYLGGSSDDGGTPSIRVDEAGSAYLLIHTSSSDAPSSAGAYQRSYRGGIDLFLAKVSLDGSALAYGTYFGGGEVEFTETHGLSIDGAGNAYVTATTKSADLPVTAGVFQPSYGGSGGSATGARTNYPGDGFIAKISADGSTLIASTFLGGSVGEGIEGSGVDEQGSVYVAGATYSRDFPITPGAVQSGLGGGGDAFLAKLSSDLSRLLYSTYLGGAEDDWARSLAVTRSGGPVLAGMTLSRDWPVVRALQPEAGGGSDGVLVRFGPRLGGPE